MGKNLVTIYICTYKHDNSPIEGKNWQVPPLRQYVSTGHLWIDKIPFESMAVNRKMLKIILNFKNTIWQLISIQNLVHKVKVGRYNKVIYILARIQLFHVQKLCFFAP